MPRSRLLTGSLTAILLSALTVGGAAGSSHREAPYTIKDSTADNTDVYAFVSPDDPTKVTLIANFIPLQEPDSGPFFYNFDPAVLYEIHVDNDGDGRDDVTFQFRFRNAIRNPAIGLYNTGPVTSPGDPDFNYRQLYSLTRIKDGRATQLSSSLATPPVNIGPRSTPNYARTAAQAVHRLPGSIRVFAGQREEGFFVDIGSIADSLGLRPFNPAHKAPLAAEPGVDGLSGFNVHSLAIQLPITALTRDGRAHPATNPAATIGVWASASRQTTRVLRSDGRDQSSGAYMQVSRLGNPLVNELLVPIKDRDRFNRLTPATDSQFAKFVSRPEPAKAINALYPSLPNVTESGRTDLVAILLTGVPGLNYTGARQADMLRLNTGLKPARNGACYDPALNVPSSTGPSRLGVLDGDLCGFPNGRRLTDDVVDIEIRSIAQGYGSYLNRTMGLPNKAPNNTLGDGADQNDVSFLTRFPYLATPHQGYSHEHIHESMAF